MSAALDLSARFYDERAEDPLIENPNQELRELQERFAELCEQGAPLGPPEQAVLLTVYLHRNSPDQVPSERELKEFEDLYKGRPDLLARACVDWPALSTLMRLTRYKLRTVRKALRLLERWELIKSKPWKGTSSRYYCPRIERARPRLLPPPFPVVPPKTRRKRTDPLPGQATLPLLPAPTTPAANDAPPLATRTEVLVTDDCDELVTTETECSPEVAAALVRELLAEGQHPRTPAGAAGGFSVEAPPSNDATPAGAAEPPRQELPPKSPEEVPNPGRVGDVLSGSPGVRAGGPSRPGARVNVRTDTGTGTTSEPATPATPALPAQPRSRAPRADQRTKTPAGAAGVNALSTPAPCHLPPCPLSWYQLKTVLNEPRWLALPPVERFTYAYEVRGCSTQPWSPEYPELTALLRDGVARGVVNHYDLQRTFAQRRDAAEHEWRKKFWTEALERLDAGTLLDDEPPPEPDPRE